VTVDANQSAFWIEHRQSHVDRRRMLILAGGGKGVPLNYSELERWTRAGFERSIRSRHGSGELVTARLTVCYRQPRGFVLSIVSARPAGHTSPLETPRAICPAGGALLTCVELER
jgi:hypothetical protein